MGEWSISLAWLNFRLALSAILSVSNVLIEAYTVVTFERKMELYFNRPLIQTNLGISSFYCQVHFSRTQTIFLSLSGKKVPEEGWDVLSKYHFRKLHLKLGH